MQQRPLHALLRPFSAAAAAGAPLLRRAGTAYDYMPQRKGPLSPPRPVPPHIALPPYIAAGPPVGHPPAQLHDAASAARMRVAGAAAAELLALVGELVRPGVTTDALDAALHAAAVARGVYPSPLGYGGFPKSVCASINEVVCHGIPDTTAVVRAGDLVKLDVSVYVGGVHGDTCRTFIAGGPVATDAEGRRLTRVTRRALASAVAAMGPGVRVSRVGEVVHDALDAAGYTPVRSYAGHGIGCTFHTLPLVWHHRGGPHGDFVLRPGHTFTIEPMVSCGGGEVHLWPEDGWTVVTSDGSRCAQFEHTLLVTEHGVDVLTAYPGEGEGEGEDADELAEEA